MKSFQAMILAPAIALAMPPQESAADPFSCASPAKTFKLGGVCDGHFCRSDDDCLPESTCALHDAAWDDSFNWDPTGVPVATDDVCLKTSDVVYIAYTNVECDKLYIASGSRLNLGPFVGDSLTVNGSIFEVDGELHVYESDILYVGQSVTITGSGRLMGHGHNTSAAELTSEGAGSYTVTIDSGQTLDTEWDINVNLVNNGTVVARRTGTVGGELTLLKGGSGTGTWAAEGDGTLVVADEVTGGGKWELIDDAGAEIRFDAQCKCLTGDVEIRKGTWHANQKKVITTGNLTMAPPGVVKVTGTGTGGSNDARVRFSGVKPGVCP